MRILRSAILSAALLTLAAGSAMADAKTETQQLYKSVTDSAAIFIESLNDIGDAPKAAIPTIEQMVKLPVQKARFAWLKKVQAQKDQSDYLPFFVCESAGVTLEDISAKYLAFLRQSEKLPDLQIELKVFREDLTECESALGLKPALPEHVKAL